MTGKSASRMRSARSGQLVLETRSGAKAAASLAVAVSPAVLAGLRPHKSTIKKVIEGLNRLLATAEPGGERAGLAITINGDGVPQIRALSEFDLTGTAETDAGRERAFADARARGRIRAAEILSRADMLSADDMADRLGISRVTVNARRQRNELLGLDGAKRGFRFPAWQVDDDGKPLKGLPELFELLGAGPWAVYRFLKQPHNALDGATALDALRRGRLGEVLDVARGVARGDFA